MNDAHKLTAKKCSSFGNAQVDILGGKLCIAVRSREDMEVKNGDTGAIVVIHASPETMRMIAETILYRLRNKESRQATAGKKELLKLRKKIKAGKSK